MSSCEIVSPQLHICFMVNVSKQSINNILVHLGQGQAAIADYAGFT